MKLLEKLNIKKKVTLFIFLLLTVVLVFVIFVYSGISSISNKYESLIEKEFRLSNEIKNLYLQGLQTGQATRNIMLNPTDKKAAENYLNANEKFMQSLESSIKISSENSYYNFKDELIKIKDIWAELKTMDANIHNIARNGKFNEAKETLNSTATPLWRKIKDKIIALDNSQQGRIIAYKTDFQSSLNTNSIIVLIFGIIILIASVIFLISINRIILTPILKLNNVIKEITSGNYHVEIDTNGNDEIAEMSKNFSKMSEKVVTQLQYFNKIPSPIMVIDKDFNIKFMNKYGAYLRNKNPEELINTKCYDHFRTKDCKTENCAGYRSMKSNKMEYSETIAKPMEFEIPIAYTGEALVDDKGQIIGAIEVVTDLTKAKEYENYLDKNAQKLMIEMKKFSEGDLTVELIPEKNDDLIGKIFNTFNDVVKNIKLMIMSLTDAVSATASASAQISSSAEEMAAGAQEQSTQTTEIAGAVEQMTKTIVETSRNATLAAEQSKLAKEVAYNGGKSIQETIDGMNKIATVVSEAASTIKELGKSSEKIGTIIEVIDDIADQTNLLALNAAIEAARAGEHGRGFAVVADEVRKLAERTTKATKEISDMIKEIQRNTNGAVVAMEGGTVEVEKGKMLANESGRSLNEILNKTTEVMDVINQVAAASEEQSSAAEQISQNIEGINNVTQQAATGVQEIARAAEDLNNLTVTLQSLINQFKIDNSLSSLAVRRDGKLLKH